MKVLIIEDEPRAANQLQSMLKTCNFEYQLLDIIDTVEDAVIWFDKNESPDLVFMDIQLADGLSFEIFQKTNVEAPIIFTTAFDQYAIQAFKVNSIDYLLKPIQEEELAGALNKYSKSNDSKDAKDRKETTQAAAISPEIFTQLLSGMQASNQRTGILVKEGSGFVQLKISDILYFYSEDRITFGVTTSKRYIIDETIDHLFGTLNQNDFFKINRGQIVSKTATQKIEPYFNHRVKLSILNPRDQEFVVSRPKTTEFKDWMNR